jgi:hypothetical protein
MGSGLRYVERMDRMTMKDLVAAEWLKLRTTRPLYGSIPAAVALSFAAVAAAVLTADSATQLESTSGIRDRGAG